MNSIIPKALKEWIKDHLEFFKRIFPGEMSGLSKYGLIPTQLYPNGLNFFPQISIATKQKYESLSIRTNTPVASIGTCFAEEFSTYMKASGYNYLYEEENVFNSSANWGRVYTIPNLLQIVKYSLNADFPVVVEHCSKGYFDPYRESSVGFFPSMEAAVIEIRKHRLASARVFKTCELLVITLGQNEAWVDKSNDSIWGSIPPKDLQIKYSDRFNPIEFDYLGNLSDLRSAITLIKETNADVKIVVTVSPVAAYATFLTNDVITQSFAGKCMLRNIVHTLQKEPELEMYYFPSFEIVLCDNPKAFRSDNRHVKRGTVNKIFALLEKVIKEN